MAKHRVFSRMDKGICPDKNLAVSARDDDAAFGVLRSRFHEASPPRLGASLEDRPRYTPTATFETFPFPRGLTPDIPGRDYEHEPRAKRIANAAKKLDEQRRNRLDPPDLVEIVPEAVAGYPGRIIPKTVEAAGKLKERTLTNLYNQRPRWLENAHAELDRAVALAHGWPQEISTDEALAKLLALNLDRELQARMWPRASEAEASRSYRRRGGRRHRLKSGAKPAIAKPAPRGARRRTGRVAYRIV